MSEYPNLFAEAGIAQADIDRKIQDTFHTLFVNPEERIYHELPGGDMAYMFDTGYLDARTEGMSYGMMMAVQMDRQDIFDRLWLFSKTYMHHAQGKYAGYFAWSVQPSGAHNAEGPAPDGEEYYAMALFFAAARWGNKPAPFDYSVQARDILQHCLHQDEMVPGGNSMWDLTNHLIKFVPEADFSDPSYHLPHFYALFAQRANDEDRAFWHEAAEASRHYIAISCHRETGMASEYAEYDGTPKLLFGKKQQYYSDAYRVAMNIGLDAAWNGKAKPLCRAVTRLQAFFSERTTLGLYDAYMLDGTPIGEAAMHPIAIIATNAAGSLAAEGPYRMQWVKDFWNLPLRTGKRRYYDNCLYFFSLLMLAGKYKIY